MSIRGDREKQKLVDGIVRAVKRGKGKRADDAERFVRQFFANVSPQDCVEADPDCLRGMAGSLWAFAQKRPGGEAKIRVFNPDGKKDGWEAGHTVVEIVNDDMPFLVDSVTAELNRQNLTVHLIIHPVIGVVRSAAGMLGRVADDPKADSAVAESVMHLQITEQTDQRGLKQLEKSLTSVLEDVRAAVEDWRPMRVSIATVIAELESTAPSASITKEELDESTAFLRWIDDNNFTFLGSREYDCSGSARKQTLSVVPRSGLGVLRKSKVNVIEGIEDGAVLPPDLGAFMNRPALVLINKANKRSTVHRGVHLDTLLIKKFDKSGNMIGQRLYVGLFTSTVYNQPVQTIPVIRRKVTNLVNRVGFQPNSHDGKALIHILETLPRDELFQIGEKELREMAMGILHLQERQKVAIFVRRDPFGRYISCLIYLPRERYDTHLREQVQDVLEDGFGGQVTAFYTQLSDEVLARLHFIVKTVPGKPYVKKVDAIEADIADVARDWADDLAHALAESQGEGPGLATFERFRGAFPPIYRDRFSPQDAVADIAKIEQVLDSGQIAMDLYRPADTGASSVRFKVFHPDVALPLSDVLPMLENMGLKVIDEIPHDVEMETGEAIWVHDFGMITRDGSDIDIDAIKDAFEQTFDRVWRNEVEDDGFNGMVTFSGLTWRQIVVLRAYCKYLRQAGIPFSDHYMVDTLTRNAGIAGDIVALFEELFQPDRQTKKSAVTRIRRKITAALDQVQNLDEDRILRRFLNLVESTLRTNFYQPDGDGNPKSYVSFKFDSSEIIDLPLPRPMREIFVYSPRMEGVHLRGGKVARGGIRWSDRREDFRTEILGLMKAQMPKNAVIVPVGAKGGFVLKQAPTEGGREAFLEEGIACYKILVGGMLDITDNIVGDKIVPPDDVVRRDEDDPYLVVAADKGTATFSDIANGVARDYGFWLDDAFASGGSVGYDHKKMGINARGAWESVKRHFREMGINTQTEDFTVVGVGDMSGDVFGNGMLLSEHIKLVGAFNHMHIFVDPDPDPAASWKERKRLFQMGRSAWTDYQQDLISRGGGIYERSAKSIQLSARAAEVFGIEGKDSVTPNELIRAMLGAEVGLLWFGGIGTYVKSSDEPDSAVGDRVNDPIRLNGRDLRCKVIGEGANLGITQLGRIEYSLRGGRLNPDFIDNSAGVASSDHEVNIKILLGQVIADDKLTMDERNKILVRMTDDVAEHVLMDNYRQSMAITHVEAQAAEQVGEAGRFIRALEKQGELDRAVEFLPDDEELEDRKVRKIGLTRPEIAVLLAYAKMTLYQDLLDSDVPDDPWLVRDIGLYFPPLLTKKFEAYLVNHRLRREITATYITNSLLNRAGPTFINDLVDETGASPARIARAYLICRRVFALRQYWAAIEALDNVIPASVQTELNLDILNLIKRGTIWFIEKSGRELDVEQSVRTFEPGIAELAKSVGKYLSDELTYNVDRDTAAYREKNVPEKLARGVSELEVLFAGCDIVRIAQRGGESVGDTAKAYYAIGARFGFDWLRSVADAIGADNEWQTMAVSAMVDELYDQQARLTGRIIDTAGGAMAVDGVLEAWEESHEHDVSRVNQTLQDLRRADHIDLAMLSVATRHIRAMIEG
ncbi:MAG: NAD-glutamate dehydrogenase [Alphaproteobacteria bacterium]